MLAKHLRSRAFPVLLAIALASSLIVARASLTTPAPAMKDLTINVGVLELSTFQQVFEYYDKKNNVIAEMAKRFGYNLKVNWRRFPHAPEELAGMKAGDIQFGSIATFPFVAQIKQGVPLHALTQSIGSYDFLLLVNKISPIRNFEDLKGKKIGLALGTEYQLVFENFVLSEFGKTPKDLGMQYVSQPIPVPYVPEGIDARVLHVPATIPALAQGKMASLMSFLGTTGEHYKGPLGEGAGKPIPSVQKSPFAPEGFAALRHYFMTYGDFVDKHPDVVKAFVMAHQKVIQETKKMSVSQIADMYPATEWETMDRKQFENLSLARDLLYKHRDWVWTTEGEMTIALKAGEIMAQAGGIKTPLTKEEWMTSFKKTCPILKSVYGEMKYPAIDVFTAKGVADLRGKPVWGMDGGC